MVDRERDRRVLQNPIKSDFQPSVISRPKFIQLHTFTQPSVVSRPNFIQLYTLKTTTKIWCSDGSYRNYEQRVSIPQIMPRSDTINPNTVENIPRDKACLQPSLRRCSNCDGIYHNRLQCPFRPCNFCKCQGHVSGICPVRKSMQKLVRQKRRAKSRENQSVIQLQRGRMQTWLGEREPPSKGEASASQVLLTAADQPPRIEAGVDVEMTEDHLHDTVYDTPNISTKSTEDMDVVQ